MGNSKYLEQELSKNRSIKETQAKKTLISVIILAVFIVVAYIGISTADPSAGSTATLFSGVLGIILLIFFIRYLKLRKPISENVIQKCEQEIKKNLNTDEYFETFDNDMLNPAFGIHEFNGESVTVGKKFVLFHELKTNGPKFKIIRGDVLGDIKVYYSANGGVSQDIGIDLKDKNGKLIRAVMFNNKNSLFKLLDSLEKIKKYSNGDPDTVTEAEDGYEDPFVYEAKSKIAGIDRNSKNKLATVCLLFGVFLTIAGNSSGLAFTYGGMALFSLSLVALIYINIRKKVN